MTEQIQPTNLIGKKAELEEFIARFEVSWKPKFFINYLFAEGRKRGGEGCQLHA